MKNQKRYTRVQKYKFQGQWAAIVGVGNIGGELCRQLAPLGFNLILFDNGLVEIENLGNQGFFEQDLGKSKVLARAEMLRKINSGVHVLPVHANITALGAGLFNKTRLIFSCLDSWYTRNIVNSIAQKLNIPMIDSGISNSGESYGRITLLDMRKTNSPCLFCSWDQRQVTAVRQKENERKNSCMKLKLGAKEVNADPTIQPGFTGSLVAGIAVAKGIELLRKQKTSIPSQEILIDITHHIFKSYRLERNKECLYPHQKWPVKIVGKTEHISVLQLCSCGAEFEATQMDVLNSFDLESAEPFKEKTFEQLGLPKRDIVTASNGKRKIHYIIL